MELLSFEDLLNWVWSFKPFYIIAVAAQLMEGEYETDTSTKRFQREL
jgi:hypothetical protein